MEKFLELKEILSAKMERYPQMNYRQKLVTFLNIEVFFATKSLVLSSDEQILIVEESDQLKIYNKNGMILRALGYPIPKFHRLKGSSNMSSCQTYESHGFAPALATLVKIELGMMIVSTTIDINMKVNQLVGAAGYGSCICPF
ncbi:MAG: hypothetical protein U5J63_04440 [Fodinibius sp.]|nr:hypothetical protein [Fodinibius sp.]